MLLAILLTSILPALAANQFVIISDSHGVGRFGETLSKWARSRPNTEFEFLASGGSAPLQWINNAFTTTCGFEDHSSITQPEPRSCKKIHTPRFPTLWSKLPEAGPTDRRISVIVLGTNYGMSPSMKFEQISTTQTLAEKAMKTSDVCIWVGPPNMNRKNGFDTEGVAYKVEIIQTALDKAAKKLKLPACAFIDSREVSKYPARGGDGIHYHWPGSRVRESIQASDDWANGVTRLIEKHLLSR